MRLLPLALICLSLHAAQAWGLDGAADICAIRPDLCDAKPTPRRPASASPATARARCFPATARPQLNYYHLPICRDPRALARSSTITPTTATTPTAAAAASARAARRPASTLPTTFEAYLQSNAANPTFVRHGISQSAFVETVKPATMIMPNLDGTDPTTAATPAAGAAAGAATTTGAVAAPAGAAPAAAAGSGFDSSPGSGAH